MKFNEVKIIGAMFRGADRNYFVTFSNIVYISSNGRYSVLHTPDQNLEVVGTLKQTLQRLQSEKFVRVHKQYIINMEFLGHVEYFTDGVHYAYMTDDEKSQVPVSRVYLPYTWPDQNKAEA